MSPTKPLPGLGKSTAYRRHRKVLRDSIFGVTNADIRRMARRGGVKRISYDIYAEMRVCIVRRLKGVFAEMEPLMEYTKRKTISVHDVVWVLNRQGRTLYGFGEKQHKM